MYHGEDAKNTGKYKGSREVGIVIPYGTTGPRWNIAICVRSYCLDAGWNSNVNSFPRNCNMIIRDTFNGDVFCGSEIAVRACGLKRCDTCCSILGGRIRVSNNRNGGCWDMEAFSYSKYAGGDENADDKHPKHQLTADVY